LFHTPIKPDLLGFLGIGVFVCGLRDHEVRINECVLVSAKWEKHEAKYFEWLQIVQING